MRLFAARLDLISWFFFGGKSVSLKERGVTLSLSKLWKTIVLSLVVVASSFLIVFVADWLFKVDFRLWVIPIKAFTPDKFGIIAMYLPFFLAFYVAALGCRQQLQLCESGQGMDQRFRARAVHHPGRARLRRDPVLHLLCHRQILDRGDESNHLEHLWYLVVPDPAVLPACGHP